MKKNLNSFERLIRVLLGLFFLFAAWQFYKSASAQILSVLFAIFSLGEAVTGKCGLMKQMGVHEPNDKYSVAGLGLMGLGAIQAVIAYEWWSAGWEKISSPKFVDGIQGTLGFFAGQNPFPWYKSFLLGFASQNAKAFAYTVEWSQIAIGIVLIVSTLVFLYVSSAAIRRLALIASLIALLGGLLMNANFYLAAGWTGPGARAVNVLMFWVQILLIYVWVKLLAQKEQR
ncbi:MAG: DoxX family protein [Candidatus Magasanikbacteria bacterium]|nr:DoxX family protein [Candidatus Magasanikbacteria bacterium]